MKREMLIASILLFACTASAASEKVTAGIVIDARMPIVKTLAAQHMRNLGYAITSDSESQTFFVTNMTGASAFLTLHMLSPSSCDSVWPRLFLTFDFLGTAEKTTVTISAQVEHTTRLERPAVGPVWASFKPMSYCAIVRERPYFIRTQHMLNEILSDLRSDSETAVQAAVREHP